uniref:Deleted in malignant brain tumors 1 protein-like n=1 Tax=Oncorhynchus kisutch TaxID=8019 RepID=A0A8C7F0E9_ONCKI
MHTYIVASTFTRHFATETGQHTFHQNACSGRLEKILVFISDMKTQIWNIFCLTMVYLWNGPLPAGAQVRLVNGNGPCSGRVEIYHNSQWGTVCDDNWDMNDAKVVCKQLDCGSALRSPGSAYFGQGSGQILMDNIECSGSESTLRQCSHTTTHDCKHGEDAGVVCLSVVLLQPNISLNAPNGGMFWGLQGPEVTRGHSFSITCSIQPQYPGGLFYLDFSGSNRTETEPAVNHSASFHFPVADYTDQGNYSCVYEVNVSTLSFHSTKTELLTVGIRVVLLQPNISLNAPNGGMFWGLQGPEVTRGHSFSITCSIQPQYPGGLFYLDLSGSNRTETEPAVNHSASFHFPVADYTDQGNYSCVYEVNVSTLSFHSTKTELLTVSIRASIVPIISPGAICGLLLLLLLLITCLVWKKISSREQSIMINPRETANNISTYGNTVVAASEENDEEDYVNVETFVNKRKDEDLKKGCHAGMYVKRELLTTKNNENAPGAMNKFGNNQGEGPESSEEDESDYENADIFTERDFAEDIYDEDSESLDLEQLTSCKSGRENDYEEDDNIYANNE